MLVKIDQGQGDRGVARPEEPLPSVLTDTRGRTITNLRISVTDRCNLRCTYCMPEEVEFVERKLVLSYEEIARFVRIIVRLGINKLRITGGEPLVRKGLPDLVSRLAEVDGINDIAMTTNGVLLKQQAAALREAGLQRLNISLDTLVREKFTQIARRDALDRVLAGIHEAKRVGFAPIKVNAVAVRGFTDDELLDFARLAREDGYQVRFIEFMPMDADGRWEAEKVLPGSEILERIDAAYPLQPVHNTKRDPAALYRFKDGVGGNIGVIPTVTEPFCDHCNRIRITADGKLLTCLFGVRETDIRALLRGGASDDEIAAVVAHEARNKEPGHKIGEPDFVKPVRAMYSIGG